MAQVFLGTRLTYILKNEFPDLTLKFLSSRDCSLLDSKAILDSFKPYSPDLVYHLVGKVGGILDNQSFPVNYLEENLLTSLNVIKASYIAGAQKIIATSAGCGHPENAPNPIDERHYWNGYPQPDSAPYSLAKRMLQIQAKAYLSQYNLPIVIGIPGNVYGEYDNFNLYSSHVIPALIRKFLKNDSEITIWGDGKAKRDFVHAEDVCRGLILLAEKGKPANIYNLSYGKMHSINEIVKILANIKNFKGEIKWDLSKPVGQSERLFSLNKSSEIGYLPKISIESGLKKTFL